MENLEDSLVHQLDLENIQSLLKDLILTITLMLIFSDFCMCACMCVYLS